MPKKEEKPPRIYKLQRETYGWFFGYGNEDGNFISIADFDSIQKIKAKIISIDGKEREKLFIEIKIKGESRMISSKNPVQIKTALKDARVSYCKKPIEIGIINCFIIQIQNLFTKEINLVEAFGYYNNAHIDSRNYMLTSTQSRREGFSFEEVYGLVEPTKEYEDFIKMKYDVKLVKKVIKILNEDFPRVDEKEDLKKTICWCVGSVLKFQLKQLGVDLFSILEAVGKKNTGKTTRLRILIAKMFNSDELTNESLNGTAGSRLISLNKDTFPAFADEVRAIKHIDSWKNGCTSGVVEFPKGQKDGGHIKNKFYKSLAISTNQFNILDDAMEDRISVIDYTKYQNSNRINHQIIEFLEKNIVHLGRYIYEKLGEYNYEELVKKIRERDSNYTARDLDKIVFYKVAEKILNDIGLYSDVELCVESILTTQASQNINLNITIREIIRKVINDFSYKDGACTTNYTVRKILEDKNLTENTFRELEKKGLFLKQGFDGVIVGANMLTTINNELRLRRVGYQYHTITELAEVLEINDLSQYNPNNPHHIFKWQTQDNETGEFLIVKSTKRGIFLFTKNELLEEDTSRYINDT